MQREILVLENVLSADELAVVERTLRGARFVDGAVSAAGPARQQKRVLQLDRAADGQREIGELIVRALLRHPTLQVAVLPKAARHPTINRYEPGMYYGRHLDAPLMAGAVSARADLSATVFLNDPASYEGGELAVHGGASPFEFKGRAGDAVIYSADTVHEVKPVKSGVRLVAVTWIQSMIRGATERRILFDLSGALDELERQGADGETLLRLRATHNSLLRLWAEP